MGFVFFFFSGAGGSMRIGVIEEVDEQMTMTSMRPETRTHVANIFPQSGPPMASAPVDVPRKTYRNGDILSTSAPAGPGIPITARYPR